MCIRDREKERLQLAFEKADSASKAKTEFVNRMSHDIRTPINGIMGMLDIIRKNKENPAKLEECLGKIQLSAGHLMALADDVLDMKMCIRDSTYTGQNDHNLKNVR